MDQKSREAGVGDSAPNMAIDGLRGGLCSRWIGDILENANGGDKLVHGSGGISQPRAE